MGQSPNSRAASPCIKTRVIVIGVYEILLADLKLHACAAAPAIVCEHADVGRLLTFPGPADLKSHGVGKPPAKFSTTYLCLRDVDDPARKDDLRVSELPTMGVDDALTGTRIGRARERKDAKEVTMVQSQ